MTKHYDTIVIGAGPGGLAAAYALNATQQVLVVEANLWGGTCPNAGCDPKKMLYGVVEAKRQGQRYAKSGLVGTAQVDWPALMTFKHSYTDRVPTGTVAGLTQSGIDHIHGQAHFVGTDMIQVDGTNYTAQQIIIATGATPTLPDIPGQTAFQTSTDFLNLAQLPAKIGFVGAGYVAIELANIAVEAGAEVHIFQHNERLLRGFPASYTEKLRQILQAKGIHFHMNTNLTALKEAGQQVVVTTDTLPALTLDAIFAAAGRRPQLDDLNLSDLGIATKPQGIVVNERLQTNVPTIYAIGDAVAKQVPKLTPVASLEGRYVAQVILGQTQAAITYPAIPHTVFAGPELAQVGVTLDAAKQAPEQYMIQEQVVGNWYTYHRIQDQTAEVTTIQDRTTGQLVGAVVLAINAEELINHFAALISKHEKPETLRDWMPIYPSVASDLGYFYSK